MKRSYRESNVEITVRDKSSPVVEIILKEGATSVFRTTMSFPNMPRAQEYARYMARGMGETSYEVICSAGPTASTSGAKTANKSFRSTSSSRPARILPFRDSGMRRNSPTGRFSKLIPSRRTRQCWLKAGEEAIPRLKKA